MNGIIDIRGVEFSYPDGRKVLHGVDLEIGAGERVAILGPNGAGKTTLALHLNGILQPRAGTITVSGIPVVEDHYREVRRMVGLVFQDPNDQLFMPTVREDVAFGPANLGLEGEALDLRVDAALEVVSGVSSPIVLPTTSAAARSAGPLWRPCCRWSPRCSCSTSRPPASTPPGGAS